MNNKIKKAEEKFNTIFDRHFKNRFTEEDIKLIENSFIVGYIIGNMTDEIQAVEDGKEIVEKLFN